MYTYGGVRHNSIKQAGACAASANKILLPPPQSIATRGGMNVSPEGIQKLQSPLPDALPSPTYALLS